jgi:hypothetical protein
MEEEDTQDRGRGGDSVDNYYKRERERERGRENITYYCYYTFAIQWDSVPV